MKYTFWKIGEKYEVLVYDLDGNIVSLQSESKIEIWNIDELQKQLKSKE